MLVRPTDLTQAFTAAIASPDSTLFLLQDVATVHAIEITSGNFTLDLNGWKISSGAFAVLIVRSGVTLTIADTGIAGGQITGSVDNVGGTLLLEGGTFKTPYLDGMYCVSNEGGTLKLSGNPAFINTIADHPYLNLYKDSPVTVVKALPVDASYLVNLARNGDVVAKGGDGYTISPEDAARFVYYLIPECRGILDGEGNVVFPAVYTVTFNGNGGEGSMDGQPFVEGKAKSLLANTFTRKNYKFLGWSEDKGATTATYLDGGSFTATEGTILYAVWEELPKYTVTFDANEGAGQMESQTFYEGETQPLSANTFTRKNYKFLGWSEDKEAITATYLDEASFTTTKVLTLYAVWDAEEVEGGEEEIPVGSSGVAEDKVAAYIQGLAASDTPHQILVTGTVDGGVLGEIIRALNANPSAPVALDLSQTTGLTKISTRDFSSCTSLTSIKLPSGITSIGNSAFYGCTNLASVEIPSSVENVDICIRLLRCPEKREIWRDYGGMGVNGEQRWHQLNRERPPSELCNTV